MNNTIRHSCVFRQPPEIVWKFLTDPELLSQWLMPNDFKAATGHKFQFKTKARIGFDGNIYCQVLDVIPNKKLSYSWQGGPAKGKTTLDSIVTWTLTETPTGTELVLEHAGFKGIGNFLAYIIMNKGWARIIKRRLFQKVSDFKFQVSNY